MCQKVSNFFGGPDELAELFHPPQDWEELLNCDRIVSITCYGNMHSSNSSSIQGNARNNKCNNLVADS